MSLFWLVHETVGGWDWWLTPEPTIAHSVVFGAAITLATTRHQFNWAAGRTAAGTTGPANNATAT